jgi:hypothetical protein
MVLFSCSFLSGCKDLMQTQNEEKFSGDDFWTKGDASDVNAYVLSMYASFRKATLVKSAFIVNAGDLRCAPVAAYNSSSFQYIGYLATNNLKQLMAQSSDWRSTEITRWKTFYEVVQQANILIEEIDNVPGLTTEQVEGFKAEAIFMRNLTFFFLVRVFGDIPYYTKAYNEESLGRSNMVDVLKNCLAELNGLIDRDPDAKYMPWVQSGGKNGVRANRGAVMTLMMHINMWLAKFDASNATTYYRNVVEVGGSLETGNGGNYYLLDIKRTTEIFRGGTAETFFEIAQNVNTSEVFLEGGNFSNLFSAGYRRSALPYAYYTYDFLTKIFPPESEDKRRDLWFDENIYQADGTAKEVTKFLHIDSYGNNLTTSNSGNYIIFRYADALLLHAEAQAALGDNDAKAQELVNMVKARAQSPATNAQGKDLQDEIFWERVRELIGEGQYFFDLVRTGKIQDRTFTSFVITKANFNAGAWTWPIHPDAFINNTKMTYNSYWQ